MTATKYAPRSVGPRLYERASSRQPPTAVCENAIRNVTLSRAPVSRTLSTRRGPGVSHSTRCQRRRPDVYIHAAAGLLPTPERTVVGARARRRLLMTHRHLSHLACSRVEYIASVGYRRPTGLPCMQTSTFRVAATRRSAPTPPLRHFSAPTTRNNDKSRVTKRVFQQTERNLAVASPGSGARGRDTCVGCMKLFVAHKMTRNNTLN